MIKTKAVIFDYDGTLTDGKYPNIYKSLYQTLGYATDKSSKYYQDYVDFKDGTLLLDKFTKTTKLEKIPNKDKKFEWVFDICNIFDEHIGYIGKPSE